MNSDHTGHEVFFYHSQAGGCCDCGDSSSWAPVGFCCRHGKETEDPLVDVPESLRAVGEIVMAVIIGHITSHCKNVVSCHKINDLKGPVIEDSQSIFVVEIYNDDVHSFEDVIRAITELYPGSDEVARDAAKEIHRKGSYRIEKGVFSDMHKIAEHFDRRGLKVGLLPETSLGTEKALICSLSWMYAVAQISDGLCRMVSNAFTLDTLCELLAADPYYGKTLAQSLHNLYLTLMADQSFKLSMARAYATAFSRFSRHYSAGIGVVETSIYSVSVQFLNRHSIVTEIVEKYSFLESVMHSLQTMLHLCRENIEHPILSHRRYNPLLGDMKLIFTTPDISRSFCCTCLSQWINLLEVYQYMHPQRRSLITHVEYESQREWMNAFNLYLGLSILFDYLVNWIEKPSSVTTSPVLSEAGNVNFNLPSFSDMMEEISSCMFRWQQHAISNEGSDTMVDLVCVPYGEFLQLPRFPEKLSFHLCIHRFFANSIRESCKYSIHMPALERLKQKFLQDPLNALLSVDFPLTNVVWASQIKVGKWRKNGQVMKDQLLNYADAPLCRSFRDLDLLLIQFASLGLNTHLFLNQLFRRFSLGQYMCVVEFMSPGVDDTMLTMMVEEALIFFIQLVVELPPALPTDDSVRARVSYQLQREILHRLVSGPKTYSQLQKCLGMVPEFEKCESKLFDDIVYKIAICRESHSSLEPPTLVLREEMWSEYDPSFYHISASSHQYAFENRPKLKSSAPLVVQPPRAHTLFHGFRESALSDSLLHIILGNIIYSTAIRRCKKDKGKYSSLHENVSTNESLYFRVLHIMTLMLHCMSAMSTQSEIGEDFGEDCLKRLQSFFMLIGNVEDTKLLPHASEVKKEYNTFELLVDLHDSYSDTEEVNQKVWHRWILEECRKFVPGCEKAFNSRFISQTDTKESKRALLEARKKLAREKAMQSMKNSAKAFANHAKSEFDELEKAEELNRSENLPRCIICQEITDDMIGHLGLSQVSTISNRIFKEGDILKPSSSSTLEHSKDLHYQKCGHSMHLKCFDDYFATVVLRSEQQHGLILDTKRGQFQCPLCRRLNNVIVPHSMVSDIYAADSVVPSCDISFRWLCDPKWGNESPGEPKTVNSSSEGNEIKHVSPTISSITSLVGRIRSSLSRSDKSEYARNALESQNAELGLDSSHKDTSFVELFHSR